MAEIEEAAIQKRARALAEADGFAWEQEFRGHTVPYGRIELKGRFLDEETRQQYLDRARAELRKEADCA